MGVLGAQCFHTLSDDERFVQYDQWNDERFGMICGKADAFADMKSAILRLCKMSGRCTYEDTLALEKFEQRLIDNQSLAARSRVR